MLPPTEMSGKMSYPQFTRAMQTFTKLRIESRSEVVEAGKSVGGKERTSQIAHKLGARLARDKIKGA